MDKRRFVSSFMGAVQSITLSEYNDVINNAAWIGDQDKIVTSGEEGTVRIWELGSVPELPLLTDHKEEVSYAEWSPDGNYILTIECDARSEETCSAQVWDKVTRERLFTSGNARAIYQAKWNPDGSRILVAQCDEANNSGYECPKPYLYVWDLVTRQELFRSGHTNRIKYATWSSDGTRILTVSDAATVRVWDTRTGKELLGGITGSKTNFQYFDYVDWSPDENYLLTSSGGTAQVWDIRTGKEIADFFTTSKDIYFAIQQVAWNPDNRRVLVGGCQETAGFGACADNSVTILNAMTGQKLLTLSHAAWINSAVWNSNGTRLLTASGDDSQTSAVKTGEDLAQVWDSKTGKAVVTLHGHTDAVNSAFWSSDENYILTASEDGSAKLWDAKTGVLIFSVVDHNAPVSLAIWNPDGSRILTAGDDGITRQWYVQIEDLVSEGCRRAARNMTPEEWQQHFVGQPYQNTCPALPAQRQ